MSYQVLARRWRPQRFEEVVGQEPVTRTLVNALAQGRVAHAFLFAGPRGVGKTTTARILAKALNCEAGATPTPCNVCLSCAEIAAGNAVDCIEIDGATHTQVEKVRELQEQLIYHPVRGRYKIYIIDEVHMLSQGAFNALLKTLEEPPARVVFILATTEPHRVPATIHSRCQRYDFRRIGHAELAARLRAVAAAEQIELTEDAVAALTRAADGSLRDGQSILDQVIAYAGKRVRGEDVAAVLGWTAEAVVLATVDALLAGDAARVLDLVDECCANGRDLRVFTLDLLHYLRDLLVVQVSERPSEILGFGGEALEARRERAHRVSRPHLELMMHLLWEAEAAIRRSAEPRFTLEMVLVRMTEAQDLESIQSLLGRLEALEARLGRALSAVPSPPQGSLFASTTDEGLTGAGPGVRPRGREERAPPPVSQAPPVSAPAEAVKGPVAAEPPPGKTPEVEAMWRTVKERVGRRKQSLAPLLDEAVEVSLEADTLTITFANGTSFARSLLEDLEIKKLVADVAAAVFGRRLQVACRFVSGASRPTPKTERPAPDHPLVREALQLFEGTILEESGEGPVHPC
ncbi:MAG: DNA polymerase III subunit gamma/tau [Candidatus Methylomirabilales bacterium]